MSREVIILGRKHGAKTMELLSGPEVPAHEQNAKFKDFCRVTVHPEISEVQLWESSGGRVRVRSLLSPKEAKQKAERDAKAKADAEAKKKAADKAAADKATPQVKPAATTPPKPAAAPQPAKPATPVE